MAMLLAVLPAHADGTLSWASDGQANVPYVFHDPADQNRLTGFEYEIVQALSRRFGMTPRFIQNDWDGLIPGLQRGLYGMVLDGIEMTPEHAEAVLFSRPYYVTAERITLRRDEPDYDTLEKLHGHVVGTIKDTLAERMLRHDPSITLRSYEEETNAYSDLRDGRLDAILLDGPIAQYYGQTQDDLKVVGAPIGRIAYGIAFAPGNHALHDRVDAALAGLIADGTLHRILARWGLWTPQMANETGDHSTPAVTPSAWDAYRAALAPRVGWRMKLDRYVGFIPLILHGAWLTLAVSALAMVLAVALGLLLALMRAYGPKPVVWAGTLYVEVVRGTPLLIQVLFIFYGLPSLGVRLSPFVAGVIALGLNYAAYEAENYRAGLTSVARGQMEAAIALNLTHRQALRLVIVPQAFRIVVPVMTNDFISLLKDSSLVSVITLTELSETYVRLSATYYDYLGPGLMVGAAYLVLGLPFVRLARWAERRMGRAISSR
ncbi:ABC transporter substrate-binding protein/permease [Tanticharoenia sakaeratensis]|uniref:Polar amino acid ABC transporter inner membrane subunit n=1 Tax=Tanticharoenia sakaeratensis NBRC 103193 TaxID=1231623 RepID=A0A0D6MND1_9PROT|nr:ABC transporter substrate-binding protein/permease [Tanticharoenia sakaeratensis]GAN54910.1 polar amino acid ABC transporter inner membrane subunit [Tanticharoenia sakaeratensis NBRC 103193]GBQ23507.1 amino acid ABC transporter permease [Tanticharoenia sakaeratensis NBRC 103193]